MTILYSGFTSMFPSMYAPSSSVCRYYLPSSTRSFLCLINLLLFITVLFSTCPPIDIDDLPLITTVLIQCLMVASPHFKNNRMMDCYSTHLLDQNTLRYVHKAPY